MFLLYIDKQKPNSFFHVVSVEQLIHEPYKLKTIGLYFII